MSISLDGIILFNFKSFRGEVIIRPISPFVAIIGRNGSGKSNIMDAISFAMGEKVRNLRVKQLKELIYGASVGNPIAHSAYVTAVLISKDERKSFTRIICNSSCEYKINNQEVTARDYLIELERLGLNVKAKNFLIRQGDVESLVMQTPRERTQTLEEISNSIEFKAEYERLKHELSEQRSAVKYTYQKKRSLLAKRKQALQEILEADAYEKLQKECLTVKSKLQLFELFHIKMDTNELQDVLIATQLKVKDLERDKEAAIQLLKMKKEQMDILLNNLVDSEKDVVKAGSILQDKEVEVARIETQVSILQKKIDSLNFSLNEARISHMVHTNTLKELNDKLSEVEEMKNALERVMETQVVTRTSSPVSSSSQVEEYFRLKQIVGVQTAAEEQQLDALKHAQSMDQNKLDNENRQKAELENKLERRIILKNETEKRLRKLKHSIEESEHILRNKRNIKYDLESMITECKDKSAFIEKELEKVSILLGNISANNYLSSKYNDDLDIVKALQQLNTDVYGYIRDICKPIHSRYEIAVTKVFGMHMNSIVVRTVETAKSCITYLKEERLHGKTFLPLDNLKVKPLNRALRDIKTPRNVKLLCDVIQFPPEIENAILFVTNNSLVSETSEDAYLVAYNMCNDCVALDGTMHKKSGIISGGQTELLKRTEVWKYKELHELESKKTILREQLRQMSGTLRRESELNMLDVEINGLLNRLKYQKHDLNDVEAQVTAFEDESKIIQDKLKVVYSNIAAIENIMEQRNGVIEGIRNQIHDIENNIFEDFCSLVGVINIHHYEKGELSIYREQANRKQELDDQYYRILAFRDFELSHNTESLIQEIEINLESLKDKLIAAHEQKRLAETDVQRERINVRKVQDKFEGIKAEVKGIEKDVAECRQHLGVISKLLRSAEIEYGTVLTKLRRRKTEWRGVLQNSKIQSIIIPVLSRDARNDTDEVQNITIAESDEADLETIDFSGLSESLKSRIEIDITTSRNRLTNRIAEIQSRIDSMDNLNFKAPEKLRLTEEELKNINATYEKTRIMANITSEQFEKVKLQRSNRFSDCFESIGTALDRIYKNLVRDDSVQAMFIPDNPEEPYLGGIIYSCIASGKRFQPLATLSGGEKTMAALAVIFAVHRQTPFFVFDEVDAALDNVNIRHLKHFIKSKSEDTQFIVISLNRKLYSDADALVGICSQRNDGCPESLAFTLSLSQYGSRQ